MTARAVRACGAVPPMTTRNSRSPRAFLGRQIQRLREEAGWTRAELARNVVVSESLVRAWERGRRIPQPDDLDRLDQIFGTHGLLAAIRNDLVRTATPLEWLGEWTAAEARATSLWSCEVAIVPGLLQTEDYARAVLSAANLVEDIDEMVAARMKRQQILAREDPPMIVSLIPESALGYRIGGPKVMHDQLLHIADMAWRDNVIVQIIPNHAAECAALIGPFVLLSWDAGDGIAYVDNALGGQLLEDVDDIVRLRRMFDVLRAAALPRNDSIELLQKVAGQWMACQ